MNSNHFDNTENLYFFFKGRVALYAILRAIGIDRNDEVILPGFTCVVVPNAIVYLGAKPVYVDINPETYNIDPSKIEEKITRKTKAIIAQHTFGIPAEMDKILDIAKEAKLFVIEDSCHALGSRYKGIEVGTFGDAAFFSSQWSKPVTTGLGGWAKINNPELKLKIDETYHEYSHPSIKDNFLLRLQYILHSKFFKPELFWVFQDAYRSLSRLGLAIGSSSKEELMCNFPPRYQKRMSSWQEHLLRKKLLTAMVRITHRKHMTSIYKNTFKETGWNLDRISENCDPVLLRYPVIVKDKEKVLREARKKRIEIGDWFVSPVHPILNKLEMAYYQMGACPVAEEICSRVINLPTHEKISEEKALRIVDFVSPYL